MIDVIIKDSSYGYYITSRKSPVDHIIAFSLDMTEWKYQKFLTKHFNGEYGFAANVYFKNREDAEKALEWVKSMLVLKKLRGDIQ